MASGSSGWCRRASTRARAALAGAWGISMAATPFHAAEREGFDVRRASALRRTESSRARPRSARRSRRHSRASPEAASRRSARTVHAAVASPGMAALSAMRAQRVRSAAAVATSAVGPSIAAAATSAAT
ncbi:MAG: hypothetical protein R3A52_26455 [Polyangiales bacterium]